MRQSIDFQRQEALRLSREADWRLHQLGIASDRYWADLYRAAFRAIIERADNGSLGSSKVQDMKRLAMEALKPTR